MSTPVNDAKKIVQRSLTVKLPLDFNTGEITHTFMPWGALTDGCTHYLGILRCLIHLLPIVIVRNPHNQRDGLYMVGRSYTLDYAKFLLNKIIQSTEATVKHKTNLVTSTKKPKKLYNMHGLQMYMAVRRQYTKVWESCLKQFEPTKDYSVDRQLLKEYTKTLNLRSKKITRGNKPIHKDKRPN